MPALEAPAPPSARPRRAIALFAGISTVALAGCGSSGAATAAQIPIVEPTLLAQHAESFGFLQAVRELSDGRVMLADPLGDLLLIVDLETGATDPVGRSGGGPGEWRQPDAVFELPGDSTLVVDLGNARLSVYDAEARYAHSYPMTSPTPPAASGGGGPGRFGPGLEIVNPRFVDANGRLYYQARPGLGGGPGPQAPGANDSLEVRRWEPTGGPATRLAGLRPPATTMSQSGSGSQTQVMMRPVPLSPEDDWAVARDGRVALVRAEPYRVEWVLEDGSVRAGPEVAVDPVPVRDAEKERWLEGLGGSGLRVMMRVENGATSVQMGRGGGGMERPSAGPVDYEWPATLPPFRGNSARIDPLGRVWVLRFGPVGAPTTYDVFDGSGERVFQARFADDRRVIGFGEGSMYVTWIDPLGLHTLEKYELPA